MRRGFTLIELLVLMAILGLLTGIAVVSLKEARKQAAKEHPSFNVKARE